MKALFYDGPRRAVLKDLPEPRPKPGAVRVKIKYCGICGSDIDIFLGTHLRAKAPLIFGHEFLGVVQEDGIKFKTGDRVVAFPLLSCGECLPCRTGSSHICNTLRLIGIDTDGGICEYAYVDEEVLFRVPESVSYIAASVIEPLAVIVRAVHQSGFKMPDSAAVIGAGPIGMLCGMVLRQAGASKVFISDVADSRLKIAESFGMTPVNPNREDFAQIVKEATGGEGNDVLFECSVAESTALVMSDVARAGATICMVSVHKAPHLVNLRDINFKEQRIIDTRVYTKEEFRQTVEFSAAVRGGLERIVSHVVPLRESEGVFDLIFDLANGTVKVLIDCDI